MRADDGAIDDGAGLIDLNLQLLEDRGPVTPLRPIVKTVVDGLPRPESLRQIPPRRACLGAVQHGLDEETVAACRGGPCSLSRQNAFEATPLCIRERVSVHRDF